MRMKERMMMDTSTRFSTLERYLFTDTLDKDTSITILTDKN
jgi:hypothetical protein